MMKSKLITTAVALTILAACTKTITKPVPLLSQSRITEYKVTSVPDGKPEIYGAIDESDSTITVYLPARYGLQAMVPEITVPDDATVSPASGTTVTHLLARMRKDSTTTYTVTAKDGSRRTYTLHVKGLQPKTEIEELSTSMEKLKKLTIYPKYGSYGYAEIKLEGKNLVTSNRDELMKVTLTDSANNVISIPNYDGVADAALVSTTARYRIYPTDTVLVNQLVDNAVYDVTVYNYGDVVKLKYPVRFAISQ